MAPPTAPSSGCCVQQLDQGAAPSRCERRVILGQGHVAAAGGLQSNRPQGIIRLMAAAGSCRGEIQALGVEEPHIRVDVGQSSHVAARIIVRNEDFVAPAGPPGRGATADRTPGPPSSRRPKSRRPTASVSDHLRSLSHVPKRHTRPGCLNRRRLILDNVGFELAAAFGPACPVEHAVRGEAIGGRVGRRQGVVRVIVGEQSLAAKRQQPVDPADPAHRAWPGATRSRGCRRDRRG